MFRFYSIGLLICANAVALAQESDLPVTPRSPMEDLSSMLFMMAIIFGIFYLFLIRPQQRQRQKHEERINTLKKGDKVIGAGGIYGEIIGMDGDKAVIAVGKDKVKIEILKSTITHILGEEEKK